MALKRLKRHSVGLFDVADRRDEAGEVGVLGGPADDSGLFGGPGHGSGLFDAPDRTPEAMPGLLERPQQTGGDGAGPADKPARPSVGGLFDKPAPRRK
jgi:hypothetical protein